MTLAYKVVARRSFLLNRVHNYFGREASIVGTATGLSTRQYRGVRGVETKFGFTPGELFSGSKKGTHVICPRRLLFGSGKGNMPPVISTESIRTTVKDLVSLHDVVIFSKTFCPFCNKVRELMFKKHI